MTTGRQVPFCLFTDPEFARVGLSEKEAKARGIAYRLFKIPMEAVMRASTLSETRGFLKALVEADGNRILGFTGFGVGAGEILSSVQITMVAGLPYTALRDAMPDSPDSCGGSHSIVLVGAFGKRAAIIIVNYRFFWRISIRVFQHRPVERSHAYECKRQMKGLK